MEEQVLPFRMGKKIKRKYLMQVECGQIPNYESFVARVRIKRKRMNGLCVCGAEAIIKSLKIVYWIFDSVVHGAICARTSAVVLHSIVEIC